MMTASAGAATAAASETIQLTYLTVADEGVYSMIREHLPAGWRLVTLAADERGARDRALARADFVLVAEWPITERDLEAAPRLRLIQHQGVGYEKIDVAACARRNVPVALTPQGTAVGVAEHTVLLMLAVYKQLVRVHSGLVNGSWLQWALRPTSYELAGKTVGIVGFGRIGRQVAARLKAFDCTLMYHDPYVAADDPEVQQLGCRQAPLDRLLARADIVTLHCPLTPQTRGLMDAGRFAQLKEGAVLINTARGALVDEEALVAALRSGRLTGAGIDVYQEEPPPADHPLFRLERVVVTPHISAGTRDAFHKKMVAAVANMKRVLAGQPPKHLVPQWQDHHDRQHG